MVCLEGRGEMPADDHEVGEAEADGVRIRNGYGPKQILVKDGNAGGIVFKKCVSVYNANGKFAPKYDEETVFALESDLIISAIGQTVEWGNLLDGTKVGLHGVWPLADKKTYQTAESDVFVGGDVFTGPKFAIDAIAAGHEAAESLHRFVQNGHMTIGRDQRYFVALNKEDISVPSYDHAGRQIEYDARDDRKGFADHNGTLTEEQVKIETSRCLGCGATIVDPNRCIGCGICTTKCAFDAIHLHRDHPEASNMIKSEDKFGAILPYMLKRSGKIVVNKLKGED